jgi:hypothetical protein
MAASHAHWIAQEVSRPEPLTTAGADDERAGIDEDLTR